MYANRQTIWEKNVAKIRKHNLEHDLGLHTYTMKMNRFGDLVRFSYYSRVSDEDCSILTADARRVQEKYERV